MTGFEPRTSDIRSDRSTNESQLLPLKNTKILRLSMIGLIPNLLTIEHTVEMDISFFKAKLEVCMNSTTRDTRF